MRASNFVFLLLLPLGAACGNGSGMVISSTDGGGTEPSFPPAPVDCSVGPNFTGCSCQAGETLPCYTGPAATRGVGTCKDGVQTCQAAGGENPTYAFGACSGEVLPNAQNACTANGGPRDGGPTEGGPTEGGLCVPSTCAPNQQVWDSRKCACVNLTADAGCPATPAHCLQGYVFDLGTCMCVPIQTGGNGSACGGIAGIGCAAGFYCDNFPANDACGGGDSGGTCTAITQIGCPTDCLGICGCDNKNYCNECDAHSKGVAVRKPGSC